MKTLKTPETKPTNEMVDWLIGCLLDWLVGGLVDWLVGGLVGWLVDWLIGWRPCKQVFPKKTRVIGPQVSFFHLHQTQFITFRKRVAHLKKTSKTQQMTNSPYFFWMYIIFGDFSISTGESTGITTEPLTKALSQELFSSAC